MNDKVSGKAVIYIHGKGGSAGEAEHYKDLFPESKVTGFDYKAQTPWEAKEEFSIFFEAVEEKYDGVILIANSIGAYFSMTALNGRNIEKAFLISPIVDMEKLISDMMLWANATEAELKEKGVIHTAFGEDLSWEYLSYVRKHPVKWDIPTSILYGSEDNLTSFETIRDFAVKHRADLTVMNGGEHWFHTEKQIKFLDEWIKKERKNNEDK